MPPLSGGDLQEGDAVRHAAQLVDLAGDGALVDRAGARGAIRSIYLRDADENLVEISEYLWPFCSGTRASVKLEDSPGVLTK